VEALECRAGRFGSINPKRRSTPQSKKRTVAMPKSIRKQKREADEKPKTAAGRGEQKKLRVKWNPAHDS